MDNDVATLLHLFGDIARIELGVTQLAEGLSGLARDPLLEQSEALRPNRVGIEHLAATLAGMQLELLEARSQVAEAITAVRGQPPVTDAVLTLYRDVSRAELDVAQLSDTLATTARHHSIENNGDLSHLAGVLGGVRERLERDRGILRQIEERLERFLASD